VIWLMALLPGSPIAAAWERNARASGGFAA
jgi:hypothetical protein